MYKQADFAVKPMLAMFAELMNRQDMESSVAAERKHTNK